MAQTTWPALSEPGLSVPTKMESNGCAPWIPMDFWVLILPQALGFGRTLISIVSQPVLNCGKHNRCQCSPLWTVVPQALAVILQRCNNTQLDWDTLKLLCTSSALWFEPGAAGEAWTACDWTINTSVWSCLQCGSPHFTKSYKIIQNLFHPCGSAACLNRTFQRTQHEARPDREKDDPSSPIISCSSIHDYRRCN